MKLFGLLGHPVSHSFSKSFFDNKFEQEGLRDCRFELIDLNSVKDVVPFKQNPEYRGFNITLPYKETILPFLDDLSEEAQKIGAVNTIKITGGKWIGHNTDVIGFEKSILPLLTPQIKHALIFGSGGAYRAVKYVLDKLSISVSLVSRQSHHALYRYEDITKSVINDHQLLVNTTPVGMYPNENEMPDIPFHHLGPEHLVYDLIYNPEETLLLKNAAFIGCKVKNGLEMLKIQAEESWKIWNSD